MYEYRFHALQAVIAGALMCIVSRLSHILAKPGTLHHEAYMSLYSYALTAMIMPVFIFTYTNKKTAGPESVKVEITVWEKMIGFVLLFFLLMIKNCHMERGIMKRFVEDYDPEVHENFPCFPTKW